MACSSLSLPVCRPYSEWLHGLGDLRGPHPSHTGTSASWVTRKGLMLGVAFLGGGFSGLRAQGGKSGVDEEMTTVGLGGGQQHTRICVCLCPLLCPAWSQEYVGVTASRVESNGS